MYVKEVLVQNKAGLHARPATFFIQKANEYKATIWVEKEERRVNAKSLLGVLSLGIVGGTTIKIIADGTDETEAVDSLVEQCQRSLAVIHLQLTLSDGIVGLDLVVGHLYGFRQVLLCSRVVSFINKESRATQIAVAGFRKLFDKPVDIVLIGRLAHGRRCHE